MTIPPEEVIKDLPPQAPRGKAALRSKGVWGGSGGVVASLLVLAQALSPLLEQGAAGLPDVDVELAGAGFMGLVSGWLAIWGRVQAKRPITGLTQDV